jgi:hypothetical protein
MPYRRRAKRARADRHDPLALLSGCGWAGVPEGDLEASWWRLRGVLLPGFVEANPGRRPWGWWAFEAADPPAFEPIPYPSRDGAAVGARWRDLLEMHADAEWSQELALLRFLAEGGHLERHEIDYLLAEPAQAGDLVCHRPGPGLAAYQWPDAATAGLVSEGEIIDKPKRRADVVREALAGAAAG